MQRIAALYDIHGNLPALEAVLLEIEDLEIDQILVGGDVIVGPMSRECLDLLTALPTATHFIKGNCEVAVLNQLAGKSPGKLPESVLEDIRWTAESLTTEQQRIIAGWPMNITIEVEGIGKVLFCHATPRNENEIFTKLTLEDKLVPIFENLKVDMVVCGHTHMQFDRMVGKIRVINAGSVGMPFGKTGVDWLLLGPVADLRFIHYDLNAAAALLKATGYPHGEDFALKNVLRPQSEELMLDIFRKAELN